MDNAQLIDSGSPDKNEDLALRITREFVDDMPSRLAALAQAVHNLYASAVRFVARTPLRAQPPM